MYIYTFVFNAGHAQLCVQCRSCAALCSMPISLACALCFVTCSSVKKHVHLQWCTCSSALAVVHLQLCTCSSALAVVHLQ